MGEIQRRTSSTRFSPTSPILFLAFNCKYRAIYYEKFVTIMQIPVHVYVKFVAEYTPLYVERYMAGM